MVTNDTWATGNTTNNHDNYIPVWDASGEGAFVKSNMQMGSTGSFYNFMDAGLPGAGSTPRVEIGAAGGNGGGAADPNGSATGFVKINGRGVYGGTGYAIAGMNSSKQDDKGSVWIADAALGNLSATNATPLRGYMGYDPTTTTWSLAVGDFDATIPSYSVGMYWTSNSLFGLNVGTVTNINQNGDITTAGTVTINNTASNTAISIASGGGDVKLSYNVGTVSTNAITVPNNVSVYYITSDNDGAQDQITLPTGTDGKFLYLVVYDNDPSGGNEDNVGFLGITNIPRNTGSYYIGITLVYANSNWRVVSVYQY
jgi:hypothetical protein